LYPDNFDKVFDLKPLSKLVNLEYLGLGSRENDNYGFDISSFKYLSNLKELCISGKAVYLENLEPLKYLTNLEYLDLSLNGHDISSIGNLENIKNLRIYNEPSNGIKIKPIGKLINIVNAQFFYTGSDYTDENIFENLSKLEYLDIYTMDEISLDYIGNLPELRTLKINSSNKINITNVLKNPKLEYIQLISNSMEILDLNLFKNLNNLDRLFIRGLNITDVRPLLNLSSIRDIELFDISNVDVISDADIFLPLLESKTIENIRIGNEYFNIFSVELFRQHGIHVHFPGDR
jgi:Leucine-rich repeat (LRR) protein